jgi:mannosyltransferase OCH1-like enzyme
MIPKLVHLSYKSFDTVPGHWKPSIEKWKELGWNVMFHSDADNDQLVAQDYPQYLGKYQGMKYIIQKVDLVRLCYLHKWGGVWCDLDLVPSRDIYADLQPHQVCLLLSPVNHESYTNMFMASVPGHPLWIAYLDAISSEGPWWALGKHLEVMYTTGPSKMDHVVRKWLQEKREAFPLHTLPNNWIMCNVCNIGLCDEGVLKVVKGQSWNTWDSRVYGFVYCNTGKIAAVLLGIVIAYIAFKYFQKRTI